jgi:regulator of RNase E activity RraA
LGQSTFTRPSRIQVPITIHPVIDSFGSSDTDKQISFPPTTVNPYDIIVGDEDGVVVIPHAEIEEVIKLCTKNTGIDRKCLESLKAGHTIADTFSKYRDK